MYSNPISVTEHRSHSIFKYINSNCQHRICGSLRHPMRILKANRMARKSPYTPRGDEHFNWTEDSEGYTVVNNNGRFEYAVRGPSGRLNPNGMVVGRDNPRAAGLQKTNTAQCCNTRAICKENQWCKHQHRGLCGSECSTSIGNG